MKVYLDSQLVELSVQIAANVEVNPTDETANVTSVIPVNAKEDSSIPPTNQDTAA